jgi:hypothetical protein
LANSQSYITPGAGEVQVQVEVVVAGTGTSTGNGGGAHGGDGAAGDMGSNKRVRVDSGLLV